jgi:hypothetical protein
MVDMYQSPNQTIQVTNFHDLVHTPFYNEKNAICWNRILDGNFYEIIEKVNLTGNITEIEPEALLDLQLSEDGQVALKILLHDMDLLRKFGASPSLNVIKQYERDDDNPVFPTDVYSFHIDRSPVPVDTFLCTYYGASSQILPNADAIKKIHIPEIFDQLKKQYNGNEEGFEEFLSENFFDLHYQAKPHAQPITLGLGHLWRLAIDHPNSQVQPCIHRAPMEMEGQPRLLLIC